MVVNETMKNLIQNSIKEISRVSEVLIKACLGEKGLEKLSRDNDT